MGFLEELSARRGRAVGPEDFMHEVLDDALSSTDWITALDCGKGNGSGHAGRPALEEGTVEAMKAGRAVFTVCEDGVGSRRRVPWCSWLMLLARLPHDGVLGDVGKAYLEGANDLLDAQMLLGSLLGAVHAVA